MKRFPVQVRRRAWRSSWRDVDFAGSTVRVRASFYNGHLTIPKSGKVRAVPLAPDVATALAQLGRRENWVGDDDLVFAGEGGDHLDASALRRRYKTALATAGLCPLRFHDLRHTFGTRMIAKADIRRVQEWMGHADIQTTTDLQGLVLGRPQPSLRGLAAPLWPLVPERESPVTMGKFGPRDVLGTTSASH
jgi:integrase